VLVWAREHGCPWNTLTCAEVARKGEPGGAGMGAGTRLLVGGGVDWVRSATRRVVRPRVPNGV
jgi:hypothetical protein